MNRFLLALFAPALLLIAVESASAKEQGSRPNIVFILADDKSNSDGEFDQEVRGSTGYSGLNAACANCSKYR